MLLAKSIAMRANLLKLYRKYFRFFLGGGHCVNEESRTRRNSQSVCSVYVMLKEIEPLRVLLHNNTAGAWVLARVRELKRGVRVYDVQQRMRHRQRHG